MLNYQTQPHVLLLFPEEIKILNNLFPQFYSYLFKETECLVTRFHSTGHYYIREKNINKQYFKKITRLQIPSSTYICAYIIHGYRNARKPINLHNWFWWNLKYSISGNNKIYSLLYNVYNMEKQNKQPKTRAWQRNGNASTRNMSGKDLSAKLQIPSSIIIIREHRDGADGNWVL